MAQISLRKIGKRYDGAHIIEALDLDVRDGEFLVLVGPSGCGKSTLLRMVAGLETTTEGELHIGGVRANDLRPQQRNISMVFQSYALYPHMTARENIAYGPKVRKEPPEQLPAKIEKAASILNLHDYLERYPRQLSGGQRQRVAMGRAIVREPSVFLFDEPLSNLDAKLRVQMRAEIKGLHARLGTTIIYVTHDQVEAMTMADRIVVMNKGRVEQIGTPIELYDRPENIFVAGFLGSPTMTFLPARVDTIDSHLARTADGKVLSLPDGAECGQDIIIGLRPEILSVADTEPDLLLDVDLVEPTGAETHLHGRLHGERAVAVIAGRTSVRPGDRVGIAVVGTPHIFDAVSTARLS
ncbi:sn-glycerol-3-phosphate ABC transporter ATP-binding protein UgpC [Rhizobium sp. VS19-DR104.2]|uniref:ABC transporter ATP-binding protein n=1 Tax=unclassified Rhizobium TaxID=2613769 RepID=UPI001C5A6492|nr:MULTISPECIES: sn-glycerol-3-phosphate ABC transporter ATP-binding protein UgpC [unclassified Rhizobium]MBZ5763233.1 sn-glycerol-3-phosphate ABC transporter ATP-binding protein UgpC [Rhizobium sp. VS19-DR96]MBZ5769169.1 sn-glycerol-3-phosphate ABC transporter ATP-binding protein UgpC [Rhizobium sp. VS19-DR129.2]MBZ5776703.1 sn-glycerol-3-phosphate ABC transporter ATP-binding protein UgpC [Rhizobium sp. VS19-DRK62.2]MBZ5787820.1 sn-glycerol-3-phosphate ABC transporter ATP-binding protein UgpC 